jgi:predicted methyltransferase
MYQKSCVRLFFCVVSIFSVVGLSAANAAAAEATSADLAKALAHAGRPEKDRARDVGRKPAEVVAFLGIKPGMTVMDLIAAGGYYTEVLSVAVGPQGSVYAQNPKAVLEFRDGANDKALTARLADNRLANVTRLDREIPDMGIAPGSLDAVLTALNFHDVYNRRGAEAVAGMLAVISAALKPGGVLGVIDHVGAAGADNTKLHRIEEALAVKALTDAGFVVEAKSEVLRHPDDDHSLFVFDPAIRGKTDRFVLRLRKPE